MTAQDSAASPEINLPPTGDGFVWFVRQGFCFALEPYREGDTFQLKVHYLNCYDTPVTATIMLDLPTTSLGHVVSISCDGGAAGMVASPWGVPAGFQGQTHSVCVYADVNYAEEPQALVREQQAVPVNPPPGAGLDILRHIAGALGSQSLFRHEVRYQMPVPGNVLDRLPDTVGEQDQLAPPALQYSLLAILILVAVLAGLAYLVPGLFGN